MRTIYLLIIVCTLSVGCAKPIVQKTNPSTVISYSGNQKTGGILRVHSSGGRVVDDNYHARYNELIELYGDQFEPDLKPDVGIVKLQEGEWLIDKEHHIKALQMAQWKRNGRAPTGVIKKIIDKVT